MLARALTKARVPFSAHRHVDRFEVDFVLDPFVAVEVDGYVHCQVDVVYKDRRKNEALRRLGWRVVRFTGDAVRTDARRCVTDIMQAVAEQRVRCHGGRPPEQLAPWQLKLMTCNASSR